MKKRNYLSDIEDRSGNAFSVIADFEGNEEQDMGHITEVSSSS